MQRRAGQSATADDDARRNAEEMLFFRARKYCGAQHKSFQDVEFFGETHEENVDGPET